MFCPNGSLIDLWIENRFLECFVETILISVLAILMTIFGAAQYLVYKYHGRPRRQSLNPQYRLCSIQIIITCLIPLMSVFKCLVCFFQRGMIFDHQIIYMLIMVFVFSLSLKLILLERKTVVSPYFPVDGHGKILLVFWILVFSIQNVTLLLSVREENGLLQLHNLIDQIELAIFICNYILTLSLLILGLKAPGLSEVSYYPGYRISCDGNFNNVEKQMTRREMVWINIKEIFKTIVFFLWPMKRTMLIKAITCVVLLISDRVVNVLILLYCTQLVVSLTAVPLLVRWDLIIIYLILKFLQGNHQKGILNVTTRFLWIQISQYTTQRTQLSFFHLMHQFSLSWHMANDDNKVVRIMSNGIESANKLLSAAIFKIIPASIDIIVAGIFFIFRFNLLTGIAIWISMISYIALSMYLFEWRVKYENQMNAGKNMCKKDYFLKSMECLETIKYCATEDFEIQSYKKVIMIDHYREIISRVNIFMLNVILSTAVCTGLLVTFCVYVNYIDINQLTMENCILIIIYITQMHEPLKYFRNIHKPIQVNYNNMHKLYSLMITLPDVSNMPDAKNIDVHCGQIEFRNVSFTYPMGTLYLYDISFIIHPGKTLAVVGPSGSGKTTILKLLLRFYNINCGYIKIDDQNIQSVTVNSLRNSMGVLPQNIVLLNNSIKFNINYGRIGANNLQVISSAVATKLHDRIKQFPNVYDTEVGLNGFELNTEELQRMAIARLLLKEPDILVLDDISKGLDPTIAHEIETALYEKCAKCTKIIVARRLSSIAHADEIIVMKFGYIQERGRHEELIANNDMYARMWYEQRKSNSILFEQWI